MRDERYNTKKFDQISADWQDEAACAGYPSEMFFTSQGTSPSADVTQLCNSCPVKQECLDYAIKTHSYGIWAASTMQDRIKLKRMTQRGRREAIAFHFTKLEKMSAKGAA